MANTNTTGSAYYSMPGYAATSATSAQKILWTYGSNPVFTNGTTALQIQVPQDLTSGGEFDTKEFIVRLVGQAAVVTTSTVAVSIYNDGLATVTAGNLVCTTGASASITGSSTARANFSLEARILWSATPAQMGGFQQGFVGNVAGSYTIVAPTALTTQTLAPASTALTFSPTVTYGTANTGSLIYVSEFSIERV